MRRDGKRQFSLGVKFVSLVVKLNGIRQHNKTPTPVTGWGFVSLIDLIPNLPSDPHF